MKIVLEDNDLIQFDKSVNKETCEFSYTCTVLEKGKDGYYLQLKDVSAEFLFAQICDTSKRKEAFDIVHELHSICRFSSYVDDGDETAEIKVKSGKNGIEFVVEDKTHTRTFTPSYLRERALKSSKNSGITEDKLDV